MNSIVLLGEKGTKARGYKSRPDMNSRSGKKTIIKNSDVWIKVKTTNKNDKSNNNSSMKKDETVEQALVDGNLKEMEGQTISSVSTQNNSSLK